jgi:hypothetical protein
LLPSVNTDILLNIVKSFTQKFQQDHHLESAHIAHPLRKLSSKYIIAPSLQGLSHISLKETVTPDLEGVGVDMPFFDWDM